MKLVERTTIKNKSKYYPVLDGLSWRAKNLYNKANYHIRQEFFASGNYMGFFDL